MQTEIDEAAHEVAESRARVSETAAELERAVASRVSDAKERVNPAHYARAYPWAALGLAIGAGLAIGLTGTERKAARGIAAGAKTAGGAIADGAVAARDAVVERLHKPRSGETAEPGVRAKLVTAVEDLLYEGLNDLLPRQT